MRKGFALTAFLSATFFAINIIGLSEKEPPPTVSNSTFKTDFGPAGAAGGAGGEGGGGGGISLVATENTFFPVLGSEKVVESGRIVIVYWTSAFFLGFGFCALNWIENKAKIKANIGNTATFLR
jgi:hypothetical protein